MANSRTKNTLLNSIFGMIGYISVIVVSFVLRKVLAVVLNAEYLGLISLYTNIVSFLSLTELGLTTAIIYFLYKPVSTGDEGKIRAYLSFYKKVYFVIAGIIMTLGVALIFVIPFIANTAVDMKSVQFYFILYVFNTAVSYLIAYKKCIIYADQRSRVVSVCHAVTKIAFTVLQIVLLLITKSFLIFILLMIACTIADNLACAIYADKKYPFIRQKAEQKLSPEDLGEIRRKMIPIALQSLAGYIVTSTDTIIISAFPALGTLVVGYYSNYTLISTTLKSLYGQVFSAFTASFGNLSVTADRERAYYVYDKSVYVAFCMACCMTACFLAVINPFINLCFGAEYVLSALDAVLICACFYVTCMNVPAVSVQNALGLHDKDVWVMMIQGIVNLVLSLVLVYYIGLSGVVIGTIVSTLLCPFFSKDYVLGKYFFGKKPTKMYAWQLFYAAITAAITALAYFVCNVWLPANGWGGLIRNGFIALFMSVGAVILSTFFTDKFRYVLTTAKRLLRREKSGEGEQNGQ